MSNLQVPVRRYVWKNIIFFSITTLLGLIGAPLYLLRYGISMSEIALFVFFLLATSLSITMGYHRLFAHMSYKAHPVLQFLLLFFGAAAFEQSAFEWASQHRTHHQFVDTDKDPYSIKKGFWYAHIGWLIFWRHPHHFENAPDLMRNKMLMNQHRHYRYWAVGAGIVLPVILGAFTGHALGALLIAVCLRLTLTYHATFCINSVCHIFGNSTYDIDSTAKDFWLAALITFGEGYHNYHHHFPADYRNGVRWYHWDPTKWLIALCAKLGLASGLKKISQYKIIEARLTAKRLRAERALHRIHHEHPALEKLRANLKGHYEQLKHTLAVWEQHAAEYHAAAAQKMADETWVKKLRESQERFQENLRQWEILYSQILHFARN